MRKKNFTLSLCLLLIAGFTFNSALFAQSETVNVPGDYPSVRAAIQAYAATASQITVNIAEGVHEESHHQFWAWNGDVEIVVQGAGANKTFIQPAGLTEMPDINNDSTNHWWQLNPMNAPDYNGSITFKDLTFRYWGKAGNRGLFMLQKHANAPDFTFMNITFENVVFDSNIGWSLFMMDWMDAYGLNFDNCLFINNVTTPGAGGDGAGAGFQGLLSIRHHRADLGITNTIMNSTFYGNVAYRNTVSGAGGRLIDWAAWSGRKGHLLIDNVVAVENSLAGTPQEGVHPLVNLEINGGSNGADITIGNFRSIGNIRVEEPYDFDIALTGAWDHDELMFDELDNIVQRLRQWTPITPYPDEYPDSTVMSWECPVDEWWFTKQYYLYTYTHPDIDFTMDGDVPELLEDEHGIGYVESYLDWGFPPNSSFKPELKPSSLKIYNHYGVIVVEDLKANDLLHIYNITGRLVDVIVPGGADRVEIPSLSKGVYIIRSLARPDERAQRVVVY